MTTLERDRATEIVEQWQRGMLDPHSPTATFNPLIDAITAALQAVRADDFQDEEPF